MKLIDINEENTNLYKRFEKVYTNSLPQFLSRIYPDKKYIKWCYINVDNNKTKQINNSKTPQEKSVALRIRKIKI